MKSMTPFQRALLAATEAQFADVPEEEQIEIHPSQEFYTKRPRMKKPLKPLRKAVLIAAALSLLAGIAFAAHLFTPGKVEVYEWPLELVEKHNMGYVLELKFQEDFANENAPNSIETYYLPTIDVSRENAMSGSFEVGNDEGRYLPLLPEEERILPNEDDLPEGVFISGNHILEQFPREATYFHAGWSVAGLQIYFSQQLAKQIPEVDFFSIQYPSEMLPEARTEILQIGNYEVLTVSIEHQEPYEGNGDRHTDHYWYWTDGDYFYSLNISDPELFGQDMPKEYMQKLMESVQPIEDMSPYSGVE